MHRFLHALLFHIDVPDTSVLGHCVRAVLHSRASQIRHFRQSANLRFTCPSENLSRLRSSRLCQHFSVAGRFARFAAQTMWPAVSCGKPSLAEAARRLLRRASDKNSSFLHLQPIWPHYIDITQSKKNVPNHYTCHPPLNGVGGMSRQAINPPPLVEGPAAC